MERATAGHQHFSSRLGLILSVLGIAVGTGNIWRFPRIAAQNGTEHGAGAFLVAWGLFLLLWSLPLIVAEYALGRKGRMGVVGTFVRIGGGSWGWMGGFVAWVATAIMFYYSVVAGWCGFYLVESVAHGLPTSTAQANETWAAFQGSRLPVVFHAGAILLGALAVRNGVRSIERINRVLIPVLLVIVVLAVLRAVTLDGSSAGVAYLFTADWSGLSAPQLWLEALTQNAWDTGAGWGLIASYAAYMGAREPVVKNAIITGVTNNVVSLLAAVMVFGIVFAVLGSHMSHAEILAVMQDSGPAATGLTFIWMPRLFAEMALGRVLAVAFFLGLSFAALSSLIAMIELSTRALVDLGVPRRRAVWFVFAGGFSLGLPSALDVTFLSNQDFVWGVGLMISGLFVALLVRRHGPQRLRAELRGSGEDWDPSWLWVVAMRWFVPLLAVVLLCWWLYLSATVYAPQTWWNPFDPYSVMTCLLQWGLAIVVLLLVNRRLASRLSRRVNPPC
jgi:neurotransmitter:Na+ symporter, NSS family